MGMRKYARQIAKDRLQAMGVGNVNRKMRGKFHLSKGQLRKMMGNTHGRKYMKQLRQEGVANWRRVVYGDLAKEAWMAQMRLGQVRGRRSLYKRLKARRMADIIMKQRAAAAERSS